MQDEAAFLDVSRSASGRKWILRAGDERTAIAISQRLGLPESLGRVMAARNVELDDAAHFLKPTLRDALPDPSGFLDMDKAAERIVQAIMADEKITVFGDYDVDGATSSAVLLRYLHDVGCTRAGYYIPDRLKEGYGPNAPALLKLGDDGVSLVITVDCGTTSFEPLEAAAQAGLDVIIIDHHAAEASLPKAVAVVNPKRLDEASDQHTQLAAVGLCFLMCVALNRTLRHQGWFDNQQTRQRREPNLMNLLDIVALGTICDVVPLKGVNRAFVHQGLKVMAQRLNLGINALGDVAGVDEPPGTYHAGFVFGPRVNAGGRVGESDLGVRLLSTRDAAQAKQIAEHLNVLNQQRQALEAEILRAAIDQVENTDHTKAAIIIASGQGWHPGVIGIVASRLKDRYNRPACVIALGDDGMGTGSGRSITGVDLGQVIIAARQSDLLIKGGGHTMAAGFSLDGDKLAEFEAFMQQRIGAQIAEKSIEPMITLDGELSVGGANLEFLNALELLAPYGAGNAEPCFAISNARLGFVKVIGADQNHIKCSIIDGSGSRLDGIAFRCVESGLGHALLNHNDAPLHIAGKLRRNTWQGRTTIQMIIDDAAPLW